MPPDKAERRPRAEAALPDDAANVRARITPGPDTWGYSRSRAAVTRRRLAAATIAADGPAGTVPARSDQAAERPSAAIGRPTLFDTEPQVSGPPADPLPGEPLTELGAALRLVALYGDRLRYVPAWRRWLVWDGTRWQHDTTGQAHRWAKSVALAVRARVTAMPQGAQRNADLAAARRGESAHAIAGALALAGTEAGIAVSPDDLDADPHLLNCANGTLDLRTGELRGHDPADLLTKVTRAACQPGAPAPEFARFLARVQPGEPMRAYLARLAGHGLVGRVTEHVLPIFHGPGANGKSTFTEAVSWALGDYAAPADPELLTARTFDAHPTGTADLAGLRLAVLYESDAGRRLAEGTVKRLTGGDRVKARRMREDFWSFEPSHTFVMLTNYRPIVSGTDEGIWRRLRLVPWETVIPAAERDEELGDRLRLEADGVLAWLLRGYRDWRTRGLADPEAVTTATAAYRGESDALARFIDQRCITGPAWHVGSTDLYAAWRDWARDEGEEPGSQTALASALQARGLDNFTSHGRRRWRGLTLAGLGASEGG